MASSARSTNYTRQMRAFTRGGCEPPRANVAAPVLTSPGRSSRPALRRNGRFADSSGGKRRPEPHGRESFRPSFSTSSVSMPIIRLPRLTRDSLREPPAALARRLKRMPECGDKVHDRPPSSQRAGPWSPVRCRCREPFSYGTAPVRRAFPLCQAAHKAERAEYRLEATHVAPCPRHVSACLRLREWLC